MAFTTWTALRTSIKDAIADHVAGAKCVGSYEIGDRVVKYRSYEELVSLYRKTFILEEMENGGSPSSRVSYGKYRRFV